jgi:hypothetical protein
VTTTETIRARILLERIAGDMRPLVKHLAETERKARMCPVCFCEYVLEPHVEDCAYADASEALALLDVLGVR